MMNIPFRFGVADIKREITDVTIVSFGKIIKEAHIAAEELARRVFHVNYRFKNGTSYGLRCYYCISEKQIV
jgi:deoxyxylulose-5-phosphate synthase